MKYLLPELLERIGAVGGQPSHETDRRSLLHAYVACLSYPDLCTAITMTLDGPVEARLVLRSRLLRMLREGCAELEPDSLVALVDQTAVASDADKALRQVADALHSAVFAHLPLPTQQMLLDLWVDRGTRGAMARWLKATKEHPALFDAEVALGYWRASKDARAAKSLAYQAPRETLMQIISELVDVCDEGWIIARAIVRAGSADASSWELVRARHPATYLYLCAQTRRPITDEEAFELVCRCPGIAIVGGRGLAIWAVGQMGMISVLDRIREAAQTLHERDTAELLARYPQIASEMPSELERDTSSPPSVV
jgi:hypothetical protein